MATIYQLKRGDVFDSPRGQFYVHRARQNKRGSDEIFGCYLRELETEIKFSTWKFRRSQDYKVVSQVSIELQDKFEKAYQKYEEKQNQKAEYQLDAIDPSWDKGQCTILAQDGNHYPAGTVVTVNWSNGASDAILGNLDGTLYNNQGEIAVLPINGINWGRVKARFLPPNFIAGKSPNADRYNVPDLLAKAKNNKQQKTVSRHRINRILGRF